MFSKKKTIQSPVSGKKEEVDVETIPSVFYGGQNPRVYELQKKSHAAPVEEKVMPSQAKKIPASMPVQKQYKEPKQVGGRKKWPWIVGAVILFIAFIAMATWYYINDAKKQLQPSSTEKEEVTVQIEEPIVDEVIDISTTTPDTSIPEEISTTTVDIEEEILTLLPLNFPASIFTRTADQDNDQLTDIEESIVQVDPTVWDTDGDGYYDGQELSNLYNPSGVAPMKLIDSGLVREYINPVYKYRIYYPQSWNATAIDPQSAHLLINAITGEYIDIRAIPLDTGQDFRTWFGMYATGQKYSNMTPFTNRFDIEGYLRDDKLVAYFPTKQFVFVVVYEPGIQQQIAYPSIFNMMVQSFRPTKTVVDIPDQTVLPPLATTTISTST
jgi:hypothetical protein